MGSETQEMVHLAVEAVMNGDLDAAAQVIDMDDRVDDLERSALNRSVVAVMQEAPVAADLRFLVSTVGIIGEIEKVGDDAVKLARRATKLQGLFPAELKASLAEMSDLARRSFGASMRLFCEYSDELANEIIHGDKEIDTAYSLARNRTFELIKANPAATESLVRTIEVFHALEHVADHAVAIAVRLKMLYGPNQSAEIAA